MRNDGKCLQCGKAIPEDSAHDLCNDCLTTAHTSSPVASQMPDEVSTESSLPPGVLSHPERIGPFKILEVLGQGGMGVVYLAEQEKPIRRRVALKLIKLGMHTEEVIGRFESERQALALMNHPNIAQVLDAGVTEQGSPYFVMEHIAGIRISDYCDRHRLNTRERLELFMPVCQAVQHAHQKGIIHRDLKPSNVLVTLVDRKPVPKVIDFGVAKATNQRLTEQTVFTQQGLAIGTPEYMSPEQAEMTGLDVDSTTDIYSLGVVLYELLVGTLPFDFRLLRQAGYDEMRRIIREQEPPTLTGRLRTLGDTAKQIAHHRRTDPESLRKQLQGDLDWITLKAMDKDRTRRYLSASELEADIQRHLKHEPVLAGPPSAVYRFRKFVSRHRTVAAATACVLAALVLGIVATTYMYVRARSERQEALWQSYVSSIRAANFAAKNEEVADLRRSLDACPPEYRGWEWDHLNYILQGNRRKLDPGGWPWLTQAFFDREGQKILAFSYFTSRIYIWNAPTLSLERTIDLFSDGVHQPSHYLEALTSDGRFAVAYPRRHAAVPLQGEGMPFLLRLGDESKQMALPELPPIPLNLTCFSADGSLLAITSGGGGVFSPSQHVIALGADTTVGVYDTRLVKRMASFETQKASILSLEFDSNAHFLATASESGVLVLLDMRTGRTVRLEGRGEKPLAFSPDGHWLAAAGNEEIRLFDVNSRKAIRSWQAGDVTSMKFTPDGTRLLSAAGNVLRLWDPLKGTSVSAWLSEEPVKYLSFAPDGMRFISTSNSAAYLWDTHTSSFGRVLDAGDGFRIFSGPRQEADLSVGLSDCTLLRIDTASGLQSVKTSPAIKSEPGSLAFRTRAIHPEGIHYLCTLQKPGWIRIVPSRNSAQDETVKLGDGGIWKMSFSHDGRLLAAVFGFDANAKILSASEWKRDKLLRIFEWPSLNKLFEAKLPDSAHLDDPLNFSPDSKLLAIGNEIILWNRTEPARIKLAVEPESIDHIAFSADGRRIAGKISLVPHRNQDDWKSRQETETLLAIWEASALPRILMKREVESFGNLVFSSDGTRLFTYSEGGIKVWDVSTLTPLISLEPRAGAEYQDLLSFDAFRQALLASTSRGEILLFRTR